MRDTKRQSVRVDIPGATITDLAALGPAFGAWPELTQIDLDATAAQDLADVSALQHLTVCERLKKIKFNFTLCSASRFMAHLGRVVGALQSLQHLELNFSRSAAPRCRHPTSQ